MPNLSTPIKSGVHRAACFALYRALLRQSRQVLPLEPARHFKKFTKDAFRANSKARRHEQIRTALCVGYGALGDLALKRSDIIEQLWKLSQYLETERELRGRKEARIEKSALVKGPSGKKGPGSGRRRPYPGAKPVLDGLPPPLPGNYRHVPTLVNANHIPFLRLKKPQSPFLSYFIRKKNVEREKRIDSIQALEDQLALAAAEDQWDRILLEHHQISDEGNEVPWTSAVREALVNVKRVHHTNAVKRMRTAQRMFDILQEQKQLADQERLDRRDRRHQAYKVRRSQRETMDDLSPWK
ncbi:MAG: hypothetical protein Q9184_004987 [Pyrenodesmia sp. 2 TL-2023]